MAGSIVQSPATAQQQLGGTSIGLAFGSANTVHNVLWVVGHVGDRTGTSTMTVADTAGNSYSAQIDNVDDATNFNQLTHWIVQDCVAATPTVTVSNTASSTYRGVAIFEIGGVQNAANDGHSGQAQANQTGTDVISSGTGTNTDTAFMLGVTVRDGGTGTTAPSIGTGFISILSGWDFGDGGGARLRAEYKASVSVATQAATFSYGGDGSDDFNTVMVLLKEITGVPNYNVDSRPWLNNIINQPGIGAYEALNVQAWV